MKLRVLTTGTKNYKLTAEGVITSQTSHIKGFKTYALSQTRTTARARPCQTQNHGHTIYLSANRKSRDGSNIKQCARWFAPQKNKVNRHWIRSDPNTDSQIAWTRVRVLSFAKMAESGPGGGGLPGVGGARRRRRVRRRRTRACSLEGCSHARLKTEKTVDWIV